VAARVVVQVLREMATEWKEDKAPRLGAALAFYTIFSLAPLMIIAIVISGAIFGQAAAQANVVAQVESVVGPSGAAAVAGLIQSSKLPGAGGPLATIVGVVTLVLGAVGVFGQLQDALNTIWEVTPRPGLRLMAIMQKRLLPFAMVLGVGFLLLVAVVANTLLAAVMAYVGNTLPYMGLLNTLVNFLLPLIIATLLFAALFKIVPDVHLAWRDIWPGAVLTAVLFTIGKLLLGFYLGRRAPAGAAGASAAADSLLAVLIWVYYTAQILFFGAEFTKVYVRHFGQHRPVPHADAQPVTEEARAEEGLVRAGAGSS
jgi:membrane protein